MWLQWVEQLAFLQDQLLSSATHAVAVVLLHLVVQLLGCGLVLVRLFTNFAFTLLAGIVVLQVNLESLAQPVLLNLVLLRFAHSK